MPSRSVPVRSAHDYWRICGHALVPAPAGIPRGSGLRDRPGDPVAGIRPRSRSSVAGQLAGCFPNSVVTAIPDAERVVERVEFQSAPSHTAQVEPFSRSSPKQMGWKSCWNIVTRAAGRGGLELWRTSVGRFRTDLRIYQHRCEIVPQILEFGQKACHNSAGVVTMVVQISLGVVTH